MRIGGEIEFLVRDTGKACYFAHAQMRLFADVENSVEELLAESRIARRDDGGERGKRSSRG